MIYHIYTNKYVFPLFTIYTCFRCVSPGDTAPSLHQHMMDMIELDRSVHGLMSKGRIQIAVAALQDRDFPIAM